jgi:hypothetical protein
MSRRGFSLPLTLALLVLCASLGIDIHAIISARPALSSPSACPLPGPRRYPPGYHAATTHAAAIQTSARLTAA